MQDRAARQSWFKAVILPHEPALRRLVRRMAATPDVDVDDIVAEALLRAFTVTDFARIDRGRTFLFTIARNLLTDIARRRAVVPFEVMASLDELETADTHPSAEAVVSARDELHRLQRVVEGLPPQCRRVFSLRRIEELSLAEIAGELGLSVSTVEKHLAKAMGLLTRAMAEDSPVVAAIKVVKWRRTTDKG